MGGTERDGWSHEEARVRFDSVTPGTVGIEEELLLVDARTGAPAEVAAELVEKVAAPTVKPELLACQVEIATDVHDGPAAAVAELACARTAIAGACPDGVVPVAAAVHPTATGPATLASSPRSEALAGDYRTVVAHQLVSALQVHVAVGGAARTIAVHDALRRHLPELAALAAASPFHEGRDTGLCSVRPTIATQLPRQGVPPALGSWERFVGDLAWAAPGTTLRDPASWWWELRPNLAHGTLELRVMDVQPDLARTSALVALAHALVVDLTARHEAGEPLPCDPTWRIAENRWRALCDGLDGHLADLATGAPTPTRDRLGALVDQVEPCAPDGLEAVRGLLDGSAPANHLRSLGVDGVLPWLAEVFVP